jgi:hypothetical protein
MWECLQSITDRGKIRLPKHAWSDPFFFKEIPIDFSYSFLLVFSKPSRMKMHTFYDKKGKISFKHLLHCITEGRKV